MKNRLYNSKEVCSILRVSLQSLRRAIASGRIRTVRIGRLLRITSEEVESLLHGETDFVEAHEAAKILNVSTATIRGLIKTGKIKGIKLSLGTGGHYKIPKKEVERIANSGI